MQFTAGLRTLSDQSIFGQGCVLDRLASSSLPNPRWPLDSPKCWLPTTQPSSMPYLAKFIHFLYAKDKREELSIVYRGMLNFVPESFLLVMPLTIREHK